VPAIPAPSLSARLLWAGVFALVLIWSAIDPRDRMTWWLEVAPALAAFVILAATWRRFPLTPMSYVLILIHSIILMVGGHFTYAEVPTFDWLAEVMGWERNNYDKVGHLAQGFVPAILTREILIRNAVVRGRGWLSFLVVCVALAISAFYELIEWWVAVLAGASSEAFLGTQGYEWDTQSDMALALIGAVAALVLLGRWHDRQLGRARGAGAPSAG
jgi:putative membrane protein